MTFDGLGYSLVLLHQADEVYACEVSDFIGRRVYLFFWHRRNVDDVFNEFLHGLVKRARENGVPLDEAFASVAHLLFVLADL